MIDGLLDADDLHHKVYCVMDVVHDVNEDVNRGISIADPRIIHTRNTDSVRPRQRGFHDEIMCKRHAERALRCGEKAPERHRRNPLGP